MIAEQEIEIYYKTMNLLHNLKRAKSLRRWGFYRYRHRGKWGRKVNILEGIYRS